MRIARLKTWRLPRASVWQLVTGALISVVIMPHLFQAGFGARVADRILSYPAALTIIWPGSIRLQTSLLALVWVHGCIGLHQWLKGEAWWKRHSHVLVALAALVPAAAVAGVVTAGREVARLKTQQAFPTPYPESERLEWVARAGDASVVSLALLALALGVALASWLYAHRRRRLPISYEPGPKVYSAAGPTLLEISRANRVPHLSVCGGKARCSTCRVRILEGQDDLHAPSDAERTLLRRIGADSDVRLACQIRPTQPLTISRLLSPETAGPAFGGGLEAAGVDRVVAVLFVDIRGFTKLSEAKLAFDIVYILNAFFTEAGKAVEACGGRVDKYIGDGMMALFEHAEGLPAAARNALAAVVAIDASLRNVNQRLAGEIDAPLAVAMGLHGGRLVSGRIGYGDAAHPTVIGPVVNVASRLETLGESARRGARDVEVVRRGGGARYGKAHDRGGRYPRAGGGVFRRARPVREGIGRDRIRNSGGRLIVSLRLSVQGRFAGDSNRHCERSEVEWAEPFGGGSASTPTSRVPTWPAYVSTPTSAWRPTLRKAPHFTRRDNSTIRLHALALTNAAIKPRA